LTTPLPSIFNVDYITNPNDGWEWCQLTLYCGMMAGRDYNTEEAQARFNAAIAETRKKNLKKCYIFGTGASLEKAEERCWDDGYRVVCNTIVRDKVLWHQLEPQFIVAGDAIYHFGHTPFAAAFRRDLVARLEESRTYFIYPEIFREIVLREVPAALQARCIAVPLGDHQTVHDDLTQNFLLPGLGNVLPLLLLPIGCTLARDVGLWGFDGRAPTDEFFWANSAKHSYPEHFDTLRLAHPAFFKHYIPQKDPNKYVRAVHGDTLEHALHVAETAGWKFRMLHHSWTETLAKRMRK
jgi:hypothetical protein